MDSIQTQVVILTNKVDALHHMIDQVNDQVSAILASSHTFGDDSHELRIGGHAHYSPMPRYSSPSLDGMCEHKDVLIDSDYSTTERQTVEVNLSQDIQIQRLTAQLTAAYHRIAALEEQLLATRVL
ncbi:hypothetical protein H6G62_12175 [Phormidium sp. FACHB-1136]|jgi:hypothetical protein|nr:hypothetical protein [Phormidium sp. FACHB-1136]